MSSYTEASELADLDEQPHTADELRSRNARRALYRAARVRKGRPPYRVMYRQWDCGTKRLLDASVTEDPVLDLYVARINSRFSPDSAARYAELRARVRAPVDLPSDAAHLMPSPETCAHMNNLVRNFHSIFGGA